ncbi:MAG: exopolysaccharide biosynthesis protein [Ruminiclostridium sp.]|nr:exopolysaccharide biosynthesis protein [Ruminiclostridium sp.]
MEELTLREILEAVWKGKWLIALITIIALVVTGVGTFLMLPESKSVVAIVELNFPGIELGLNPDGTQFDISQLRSPYVIEQALEEVDLANTGIKPDAVRRSIDITPIIPNDVAQRAETMIKQGNEYIYYPSEYKITYKVNKAFSYNQGISLVETIIREYQEYFYTLYSDVKTIDNTIGTLDYSSYDYPDIVQVMTVQIQGVQEFLNEKTGEDSNFRSSETSYNFADLNRSFDILKTVDTSKLESLVNANTLTKDRLSLIKDYEYRVKRMELEQAKKNSEAEEARRLMDQFKKEDYVLIPDSSGSELRTENAQSYYNTLAETAITASIEAADLQHEIEYYKKEIERLVSVTETINVQIIEEADQLIEAIKNKLIGLTKVTNDTIDEYYSYKYGKSIRQIAPAEMVSSINIIMNMGIALAVGLMVGIMIVLIRYYWRYSQTEPAGAGSKNEK